MMTLDKHAVTGAHWSAGQYETLFHASSPPRVALIIEEDAHVQGFLIARAVEKEWEIENIAITGPARRRGLGTHLLGELLDLARAKGAKEVFLEVRESNHAAQALYEKCLFLQSGRRRRYYQDPEEDAILYRFRFE